MKYFVVCMNMLLILNFSWGEKISDLPELSKPASIAVDGRTVYIADQEVIHIYNLEPFGYIRGFGTRGEGPGEYNSTPHVFVCDNGLFVNTMGKYMVFSKKGEFIEQKKLPFRYFYFYFPLMPVGENYFGLPLFRIEERNTSIHKGMVYNKDFDVIKDIYEGSSPRLLPPPPPGSKIVKVDLEVIPDYFDAVVYQEKIFIADTRNGFYFNVFDFQGNLLYEIDKKYTEVKVSDEFIKTHKKGLQQSDDWEQLKQRFNYKYRETYPAFFSFKIDRDRIYVTTNRIENSCHELVVLDLKGEELGRSFSFPLSLDKRVVSGFDLFGNEYDIEADRIYYLELNEDSMLFELHAQEIKY